MLALGSFVRRRNNSAGGAVQLAEHGSGGLDAGLVGQHRDLGASDWYADTAPCSGFVFLWRVSFFLFGGGASFFVWWFKWKQWTPTDLGPRTQVTQ